MQLLLEVVQLLLLSADHVMQLNRHAGPAQGGVGGDGEGMIVQLQPGCLLNALKS